MLGLIYAHDICSDRIENIFSAGQVKKTEQTKSGPLVCVLDIDGWRMKDLSDPDNKRLRGVGKESVYEYSWTTHVNKTYRWFP
jgi:hypothetical protein